MGSELSFLEINGYPELDGATMVLAFSGWMDGGDVSTGTVERVVRLTEAEPFASIDPEPFYVYNLPGSMEVAAMFRPHVEITDGLIESLDMPANQFFAAEQHGLALFLGKEPNLQWRRFGDGVLEVARTTGVGRILFVGSFGGAVPHTREPRLYCSASDPHFLKELVSYGLRPSNYEGPGSFTSYLMTRAQDEGLEMASLVAEIPGYLQGVNPASIEAVARRLSIILDIPLNLNELRTVTNEWESRVSEAVAEDEELEDKVRELEEQYDDELIESDSDGGGG